MGAKFGSHAKKKHRLSMCENKVPRLCGPESKEVTGELIRGFIISAFRLILLGCFNQEG
jgi:hypothetical protein